MIFCIYGASSNQISPAYIESGEQLGRALAEHGHGIVFGGGAAGLMGAAARGAHQVGGVDIIGIAPSFFHVDGVLYPHCTQLIATDTMRERKQKMEDLSDGFIITPGGVGTMDEFFEIFTLRQLGRHDKPIAVLNTNGYYDTICELLQKMVREGFMKEASLSLCRFFDTPDALVEWIGKEGRQTIQTSDAKYI